MKIRRLTIGVVGMALALGGCVQHGEPTPTATPTPTPTPIVRPTIPEDFVSRIDGSTATIPLATAALRLLRGTDDGLHFNTTPDAYDNLIAGDKDLIVVTAPSQDELDAAAQAGVELEVIPIIKDALVFLANTSNPVTNLTQQQVKDIYTGTTTNWNELGGQDAPILAYQRQINSGSQTLFLQLAMGDVTPMDAPSEMRPDSMGNLVDAISLYDGAQNAIGYSMYYYVQQMYVKDNVRLLDIDGISPTDETVSDETYPYLTYYYAVVRKSEPDGSVGRQLIDWFLTWEGQQTTSGTGYVPLDPSNIVPMRDEYGYAGSTEENTTQSSGTGGPMGVRAAAADPCEHGCLIDDDGQQSRTMQDSVTVSIPDYPQTSAAVQAWMDGLPPALTYVAPSSSMCPDPCTARLWWTEESFQGLYSIRREVSYPAQFGMLITSDSAVFRLSDAKQLTLSDLFYDGVNYIDFINTNLLNTATNQVLSDCVVSPESNYCQEGVALAPFTGLPADYDLFTLFSGQILLRLPAGNPFLSTSDTRYDPTHVIDSYIPLNLPADLSPYGLVWRYDRVSMGDLKVQHIIRDYAGPTAVDDIINQEMDDFVAQNDSSVSINWVDNDIVKVWVFGDDEDPNGPMISFDYVTGDEVPTEQ